MSMLHWVLAAMSALVSTAHQHPSVEPIESRSMAAARLPVVQVRTDDGRQVEFQRDLLEGRLVVLNFVFTRCTSICPLLGVGFVQLQAELGAQANAVSLVSISVDPTYDTPERLASWAGHLGRKPGWTLVTGERGDIQSLLSPLGIAVADPSAHTPLTILIDGLNGGPWLRSDGLSDPRVLAQLLRERLRQAAAK